MPEVPKKKKGPCELKSDDSDYDREFCVVQGGKREEGYKSKDVPHEIVNPSKEKKKLKSARAENGIEINKVEDVVLIVLE